LNAGAEDFIVKPLQSKDVQRLRSCSTARQHKSSAPFDWDVAKSVPIAPPTTPPPSDVHRAPVAAATASGRRGHLAGLATVRHCHTTPTRCCGATLLADRLRFCCCLPLQVLRSSRTELSQYWLPLLFKLVLLVYAALCLGELMRRWSSGGGRSLSL
jgi:two-component response regulator (ARR-A family)